jgi:hypothetical protein
LLQSFEIYERDSIRVEAKAGRLFLLRDLDIWEFTPYCGNDSSVLGLSGTSRQRVARVSSVRDGIFSCAFFHEAGLREFFSRGGG